MYIIYFKNCVLSIHSVLQFAVFTYYIANFFMLFNILLWYFIVTYLFIGHSEQLVRIFIPWPGIKPRPSAVKARSPDHWTTREFPVIFFFNGWRRSYHIALLFNQSLFLDMLNYYLCFTIINSKQISRSRTFELKYLYMFRFRICTANCTQPTTSTFHYTFTWKSLYTLIRNAYFQHLPSWSVTCFSVLPISLVIKEGSLFFSFLYI